ncbi:MAG: 30S ribosomal protein S12 methylthiotransferase RimO [Synergistaceae bacterium]|nr:30S ribosomal protein S12 methylthiotransferase RimO [Synergistaceae bacterium]
MKICIESMGCAKNTADSENLLHQLILHGHEITDNIYDSEVAIINTCGFIQDAVKENINEILDIEELKANGTIKKFIVAGCLYNRYGAELASEFPNVDLFVRSEEWDKIINFLGGNINANCKTIAPALSKNFWTRYLKVSEGCNTLCSYCAIPMIRGRLRSVHLKPLVDRALMLCAAGAKEICLVGQDLTVYGQDFNSGTNFRTMIETLNRELPSGTWLRLLYLHPNRVNEELIDFLMSQDKILHYLDIPIQHSDSEILTRMNRPVKPGHLERIFKYIRSVDDLFTLRTTVMTGFPGESEASFARLEDFISEIEFDRLGCFVYSPEEGTKAAYYPDQVDIEIAEERCARLLALQSEISQSRGELFINRELDVLLEEPDSDPESKDIWGRSYRDAPEVDGLVCVSGLDRAKLGDVVKARIYDCVENDLFGEVSN